jgi:O-methyltransferase
MVGRKRLDNVRACVESILHDNIPGDLIEAGVWRGGAAIYMRGILKSHAILDRNVWVADSFEGLPKPDPNCAADAGDVHWTLKDLAVSLEEVTQNFQKYGLLDNRVRFLKGWFSDTLPMAPIDRLALIRLDGDMYSSTMDSLRALYPKLSAGGYIIIDDYNLPGARQATDDYRTRAHITEPIQKIDWTGVYWRKTS